MTSAVVTVFLVIALLSWGVTPTLLNLRDDLRAGHGGRHRTPGMPAVRPAARPGVHVRPRAEKILITDVTEVIEQITEAA